MQGSILRAGSDSSQPPMTPRHRTTYYTQVGNQDTRIPRQHRTTSSNVGQYHPAACYALRHLRPGPHCQRCKRAVGTPPTHSATPRAIPIRLLSMASQHHPPAFRDFRLTHHGSRRLYEWRNPGPGIIRCRGLRHTLVQAMAQGELMDELP